MTVDLTYPSDRQDKFVLRLPDGMRDRIKAAAEANNRSMNAEIVATLEDRYPPPEPLTFLGMVELLDSIRRGWENLEPAKHDEYQVAIDAVVSMFKDRFPSVAAEALPAIGFDPVTGRPIEPTQPESAD